MSNDSCKADQKSFLILSSFSTTVNQYSNHVLVELMTVTAPFFFLLSLFLLSRCHCLVYFSRSFSFSIA